ncbi:SDR family NAD(P)-dependent oxidoreductase [Chitinophaga ginsengisegetis]
MDSEKKTLDKQPQVAGSNQEKNLYGSKGRIFITGSTDGLGFLAAKSLIAEGYSVVIHARNEKRRLEVLQKLPQVEAVVVGDLSDMEATKTLTAEVNKLGPFKTIIHNAGVYQASSGDILRVNLLAPYILTCLIDRPERLIYISSDMHAQGSAKIKEIADGTAKNFTYSDSKLAILLLSKAIAHKWKGIYSNAVDPGWVPTKMGGAGAPDDLQEGFKTQVWLAASTDNNATVTGRYFHHMEEDSYNRLADDVRLQQELLDACKKATGISLPQ